MKSAIDNLVDQPVLVQATQAHSLPSSAGAGDASCPVRSTSRCKRVYRIQGLGEFCWGRNSSCQLILPRNVAPISTKQRCSMGIPNSFLTNFLHLFLVILHCADGSSMQRRETRAPHPHTSLNGVKSENSHRIQQLAQARAWAQAGLCGELCDPRHPSPAPAARLKAVPTPRTLSAKRVRQKNQYRGPKQTRGCHGFEFWRFLDKKLQC